KQGDKEAVKKIRGQRLRQLFRTLKLAFDFVMVLHWGVPGGIGVPDHIIGWLGSLGALITGYLHWEGTA
ncbi:MAG: hypothetical protein ACK41O_27640, partial [Runella zeae]